MKKIFFVSMMRSGHHAILNWFARNQFHPIIHYNDCRIEGGQLVGDIPDLFVRYTGNQIEYFTDVAVDDTKTILEGCETEIFSFEERSLEYVEAAERLVQPVQVLIVVRDAPNFVASCMRHAEQYPGVTDKLITNMPARLECWREHALQLRASRYSHWTAVSFNRWFKSRLARDALASQCGFRNHEIGVEEVQVFGHGSSFDALDYDSRASAMNVLERWRHYSDDPRFKGFMSKEIIDLSNEIFGEVLPISL